MDTYYERRGDGPPLVLLHGACMVLEGREGQIDALSRQFTVVAPERRGIGRTPDYDGLWTYQGMADDTGAFMDALGIRKAYVVGFSDGGNIGLLLAIRRPDLVARLAVSGASASAEALGEFGHAVEKMSPEELLESAPPQVQEWLAIHRRVAPDRGESLLASIGKMMRMWLDHAIPRADLETISVPTLVMNGDHDDLIPVSHAIEIWSAIPGAQLGIVPGADHFWMQALPHLANDMLTRFFLD